MLQALLRSVRAESFQNGQTAGQEVLECLLVKVSGSQGTQVRCSWSDADVAEDEQLTRCPTTRRSRARTRRLDVVPYPDDCPRAL